MHIHVLFTVEIITAHTLYGDKNDEVLKLDAIKRYPNGIHHLLKTYEGRVETERIKEDLVKLQHRYFYSRVCVLD